MFSLWAFALLGSLSEFCASKGCTSPSDCSLNGDCIQGACRCDPPWSGIACESLRFGQVEALQGYGVQPNLTTWGGGVLFDGRRYHLYACVMTNGCPLSAWRQNSRIDHAVAEVVTGPYTFSDVAVNTWSHNPAPVRLPDGTFAIFHIGEGSGSPDGGRNCGVAPSTIPVHQEEVRVFVIEYSEDWAEHAWTRFMRFVELSDIEDLAKWDVKPLDKDDKAVEGPETVTRSQFPLRIVVTKKVQAGSTIHVSRSLDGPWRPLVPNSLGECNNPAPWVHSNGTIFIVCAGELKRAELIAGPWVTVASVKHSFSATENIYEDPFLYVDKRGFHIFYHAYNKHETDRCEVATVSAHAFSEDGFTWRSGGAQPFTNQVEVRGIGLVNYSTRERPHLVFDSSGRMTYLITGVCHANSCPNEAPCVNCKYSHWDYTLVQPFDLSPLPTEPDLRSLPDLTCTGDAGARCGAMHVRAFATYRGALTVW
eukprot:TRINITY_DN75465_c0_g1_i1.p1 TRINITY_DN75465_c0_g1~~TRINITY_DN75465_c0_g1_i1.p1  ORF type:complete len:479 (+),score=28.93 TRINITY_DN75465_c0_g1_i1:93-1529(+)